MPWVTSREDTRVLARSREAVTGQRKYPRCYVQLPENVYDESIPRATAVALGRRYNVLATEIYSRFHAGIKTLIFRHASLFPAVISYEEVLSRPTKEIAKETNVVMSTIRMWRIEARKHVTNVARGTGAVAASAEPETDPERSSDDEPSATYPECVAEEPPSAADATHVPLTWELPTTSPTAISAILSAVATAGAKPLWGLTLIDELQQPIRHPLHDRLSPLPLSVLKRCIVDWEMAREEWGNAVVAPACAAANDVLVEMHHRQLLTLAFNVCLWQRRHPLEVVTTGVDLYRKQRGLFQRGPHSPLQMLHLMLESVTAAMEPELAHIHPVLRCDVFMTHTHLPVSEQIALMKAAQASWTATAHTDGSANASKEPIDPRELLSGFCEAAKIPDASTRFTVCLTDTDYRELRVAFEAHKRAGVLRLLRRQYQ